MFLDIKDLELHPLDFEEEFQPGVIDLGAEARQRTPSRPQAGRRSSRSITASTRSSRTSGCEGIWKPDSNYSAPDVSIRWNRTYSGISICCTGRSEPTPAATSFL